MARKFTMLNSRVIGQIVGNGKTFAFSTAAVANVTICLDVDPSIPQDTTTYKNLDFVIGSGNTLGLPIQSNVTISGNQYCGSVAHFKSGTFIPILRNDVPVSAKTNSAVKHSGISALFVNLIAMLVI